MKFQTTAGEVKPPERHETNQVESHVPPTSRCASQKTEVPRLIREGTSRSATMRNRMDTPESGEPKSV